MPVRFTPGYFLALRAHLAAALHLTVGLAPYKHVKKWPRVSKLPLNHFLMLLHALKVVRLSGMPVRDCRWQSLTVGLAPYKNVKK